MAKVEPVTIDEDLKEGIQQARKKPRFYALIAKGSEVVGLIVQKKAISAGVAQNAKGEFKGNLVIQGVCQGDGPQLNFEVLDAEPSINPKKIKTFIDEKTELSIKPQWVVVSKFSAVEDAEAEPQADPAAEWKEKLAAWGPAIKATIAAKGPNAADMAKLLAQSTSLSKPGGDMPLALAKLAECYALADPTDLWKEKLAASGPAINAAIAAKGPNAADIAKLLAQATSLSKPGGDMPLALEKLAECHALATAVPPATDPATEWKEKLAAWGPAIKAAIAAKGPTSADMIKLLAQATSLSKPGGRHAAGPGKAGRVPCPGDGRAASYRSDGRVERKTGGLGSGHQSRDCSERAHGSGHGEVARAGHFPLEAGGRHAAGPGKAGRVSRSRAGRAAGRSGGPVQRTAKSPAPGHQSRCRHTGRRRSQAQGQRSRSRRPQEGFRPSECTAGSGGGGPEGDFRRPLDKQGGILG